MLFLPCVSVFSFFFFAHTVPVSLQPFSYLFIYIENISLAELILYLNLFMLQLLFKHKYLLNIEIVQPCYHILVNFTLNCYFNLIPSIFRQLLNSHKIFGRNVTWVNNQKVSKQIANNVISYITVSYNWHCLWSSNSNLVTESKSCLLCSYE